VAGRKRGRKGAWPSGVGWHTMRAANWGAWERRGGYVYSAVEYQRIEYPVVAQLLLIQGVMRDASHVSEVELASRVMCRGGRHTAAVGREDD
jgi:hypothetical protein